MNPVGKQGLGLSQGSVFTEQLGRAQAQLNIAGVPCHHVGDKGPGVIGAVLGKIELRQIEPVHRLIRCQGNDLFQTAFRRFALPGAQTILHHAQVQPDVVGMRRHPAGQQRAGLRQVVVAGKGRGKHQIKVRLVHAAVKKPLQIGNRRIRILAGQ